MTPIRTEIIILATRTQNVLGEKGRRIRELTSVVQKRFGFPEGTVEVDTCIRLDIPNVEGVDNTVHWIHHYLPRR